MTNSAARVAGKSGKALRHWCLGAISAMAVGFVTSLGFMIKDGLEANTPIYYSLGVSVVSFVLVSVLSRRPEVAAADAA